MILRFSSFERDAFCVNRVLKDARLATMMAVGERQASVSTLLPNLK